MALPSNSLSLTPITDNFLPPDHLENSALLDYEAGGIGLNDTTAGLRYQWWTCRWDVTTGNMLIQSDTQSPYILFNKPDVTEISFTFDQNMNPFVAYVANEQATFWWYDTDIQGTVFTDLPANSLTPRCCLDDKRETQTNSSDIILAYILNGNLYFRMQRDRYQTEYLLQSAVTHPTTGNPGVLKRIGMHKSLRVQFLLEDQNYEEPC